MLVLVCLSVFIHLGIRQTTKKVNKNSDTTKFSYCLHLLSLTTPKNSSDLLVHIGRGLCTSTLQTNCWLNSFWREDRCIAALEKTAAFHPKFKGGFGDLVQQAVTRGSNFIHWDSVLQILCISMKKLSCDHTIIRRKKPLLFRLCQFWLTQMQKVWQSSTSRVCDSGAKIRRWLAG